MEIKLSAPRHIQKAVDTVQLNAAIVDFDAKVLRYTVSPGPMAGPAGGVTRSIQLSEEKLAELRSLIEADLEAGA